MVVIVNSKPKKNIIMFVSDTPRNSLFFNRITEHLQLTYVNWAWEVNTEEQFINHIENPPKSFWDILIVELNIVKEKKELLGKFIKKYPNVIVGLLYDKGDQPRTIAPLKKKNTIKIDREECEDIDDWFLIMHGKFLT